MRGQLRSELLKIRTTRTASILLVAAAGLTLMGGLAEGLSRTVQELSREHAQRTMFGAAGGAAVLFATFAGLILVTNEFRYGTIRPTLLFEPRRRIMLAAKLAVAALTGAVFGGVCVAISFGAGSIILATRGVGSVLTHDHAAILVVGPIAACAVGGMLGAGIGALIRNQVGAIGAIIGYALVVDAVLFAAVPSAGRFLPGKAADALAGLPTAHLLAPGLGALVYIGWMIVFIVAAAIRTERSDI